ncbi:unnamed protein product [Didymodactylos carnosus]|uniref:Endoplasmic reticulum lectin 1 n=1 Tax=Didymodactylos carnosus TaxID=1234261 RepID=A0A8S2D8K7_9BILA|nr:unnamed protein product [Didymodactylos carnosus]CAF3623994.1 unnamed protein product [Didymodactylos carnosus]
MFRLRCEMLILPLVLFVVLISYGHTTLDDEILYDITWQPELPELPLENELTVVSKRKEKYTCSLPNVRTIQPASSDNVALSDVESLLEALHSKKLCSYRMDTYWSYELCHGMHIRQYHEIKVAGKKSTPQEYFLGYYQFQKQDTISDADGKQIIKIYHKVIDGRNTPTLPVRYTDGTPCDINSNQPRETLVLYVCDDKGNNGILGFEEVSSCYYELIVASRWLCTLPAFTALETIRQSISCYPKENARQKPRNLRKLEYEKQQSWKKGGRTQFTITNMHGTTFIVSYELEEDADVDAIAEAVIKSASKSIPQLVQQEQAQAANTPLNQDGEHVEDTHVIGTLGNDVDKEFIEGFLSGRECLPGGTGWWKYEICYGKHLIQFHEDGMHRTSVLLGKWNQEKHINWINANPKKRPLANVNKRTFISLYYTDGDVCDLTKKPRVAEVKLRSVE